MAKRSISLGFALSLISAGAAFAHNERACDVELGGPNAAHCRRRIEIPPPEVKPPLPDDGGGGGGPCIYCS